jgi:hypothetical protein
MAIFEGYEVSREMTRSSTATVRAVPIAAVTKRAGPVIVHADSFKITSEQRIQIVDITEQVAPGCVKASPPCARCIRRRRSS